MLHRNSRPEDVHLGKWNGLGGKFEPGESPEECAIREVREESGLKVHGLRLRGFLTFPNFAKGEDWYVFVFTIHAFSGAVGACEEGSLEWIDTGKLLDLNLWEGDRHFIPLLDSDRVFTGKLCYESGALVSHEIQVH